MTKTNSSGTINYSYDIANRLTSEDDISYTYDARGNLVQKTQGTDTTTYTYNYENRLTQITYPDSSTSSYEYDALGKRISKTVDNTTTYYFYDGSNVLLELDDTAQTTARYTTSLGIDDIISMDRDGATTFYHKDGLGSVTELSDNSQTQVGSYTYNTFGSIRSQTGSISNPYFFTARRFDSESNLCYHKTRYYNATVGRFISRDPILQRRFATPGCESCGFGGNRDILSYLLSNPRALHAYTYVSNNPVNLINPWGLCKCIKWSYGGYDTFGACWRACMEKFIIFSLKVLPVLRYSGKIQNTKE